MIVITGAAGFIGSCLIRKLNDEFFNDLILVDDFSQPLKNRNLANMTFTAKIDRMKFFNWLDQNHKFVQFVFHIGARTDTTESRWEVLQQLNLDYSKQLWEKCVRYGLPMVYASSAATYGDGSEGYDDDHQVVERLKPLNLYGKSKNDFDKWALAQDRKPYFWAGLKFFNVFGPNEYHKGRMASVVFHAFNQIKDTAKLQLFRSHRTDYADGEQKRDFVYVKDVTNVLYFLLHNRKQELSGLYNVGTGKAMSFNALANAVFSALGLKKQIDFIDTPEDIRDKYQYFTEAKMGKLISAGYSLPFTTLDAAVEDYVKNYLSEDFRIY